MRHSINRLTKLLTLAVLFAGVGSIMSSAPLAFAAPDPGQGAFPNAVVQNGQTTLRLGTGVHQAFTGVNEIAVFTDETVSTCPLPAAVGSEKRFDLRDSANPFAIVTVTLDTTTSFISMPWGTGASFPIVMNGIGTVSGSGSYHWADSAGAAGTPADSTAVLDTLTFPSCGTEGADQGSAQPYSGDAIFSVVPPVAGELIPIDVTAVLLAGALTNQMMLLPLLGLVAATAFVVLKLQLRRN